MSNSIPSDISLPVLGGGKRAKQRWTVLISVQVLILAHILLWYVGTKYNWFGGKTLTPIEPSEGMEFVKNGIVNAGGIFFVLALVSTWIFGRWFCGWGCHIVFLQDACFWVLRKMHIRPRAFRARLLMWFPFGLGVYMFIWPVFYRVALAPWLQPNLAPFEISTHLLTDEYWSTFAPPLVAVPFLIVCGFATVYVLGAKGFCTYGCPYGGFFKPLDAVSPMHVRVNDNCQQCGKCTAACTSNVTVHEEVNLYKMVIDSGCMKTRDCIDACPNDALSIGFGPTAIGKRIKPRKYDLSMAEEIWVAALFLLGFFVFRQMYAVVPMLMAVGMSLVGTWLIWKGVNVLRKENVSFHRTQLRFHGKLLPAGIVYLLIASIVVLFTAQSAVVYGYWWAGDIARTNEDLDGALRYYKLSGPISDGGVGLASNPNVDIIMSKIHESRGEFLEAERLMWRVDQRVGPDAHASMLLGQVMQMNHARQEIDAFYANRLETNPNWSLVWEDYVAWLKREGLYEYAVQISRTAVAINPDANRLRLQNALTEMQYGDIDVAISFFTQETKRLPENPNSWFLLARSLSAAGRTEEAREAAEKATFLQNRGRP